MSRSWFGSTIAELVWMDSDTILGRLAANSDFAVLPTQRDAWLTQIAALKSHLVGLGGSLFMEFSIPRMGRRVDAVPCRAYDAAEYGKYVYLEQPQPPLSPEDAALDSPVLAASIAVCTLAMNIRQLRPTRKERNMVAVECEISRGAFSGERVFRVSLPNRGEHIGAASVNYFRKDDDSGLASDEPRPGEQVKGRVAARIVQKMGDRVLVYLPDGEVVHLKPNQIGEWASSDVLVQS
jgi:hypothetical protein